MEIAKEQEIVLEDVDWIAATHDKTLTDEELLLMDEQWK